MDAAWEVVLGDGDAETITRGAITTFVRWAREHRLLPEAYLYGLAFTQELSRTYSREVLPVYLMGECSQAGWRSYFPIAFAIKTPIVTMVLLAAGVVGLLTGRVTVRSDPLLLLGLVTFAVVYFAFLLTSSYNIGHRHLLPIYPVVIVLAGASVGWGSGWTGRWVIAGCLAWLLVGNLGIHPNYLCYFNELIGGPRNGYRYLAASNVDWGQNMKRLADYARSHPREKIKLAYHGSGDPRRYGFECDIIISSAPLGRLADLAPGTYVVSVNHLLGLYNAAARDSFWDDPEHGETYRRLHERFSRVSAQDASSARDPDRERAWRTYRLLRRGRLLNQLRWRATDERIGHALFVYRLPQADLDRLTGI